MHFAKLRGWKLSQIKATALLKKPDWDAKRRNPWESEESEEEEVTMIDSEREKIPPAI